MPNSGKSKASTSSVFEDELVEKYSPVHRVCKNFNDLINFWMCLYADKPSHIPRGFRADALRETEIHRIPPEGGPNCSNDLDRILSGMQDFVSYVDDRGFVFCADAEYETVRDCLKYIEKRVTSISNRRNMTIIRIADLFLALKWWNHMDHAKVDDLPTEEQLEIEMSVVKECLSRSCYTFKANIRCDFHKQKDVAFCSLSTANKSWLHLLDYLDKEYPRRKRKDKAAAPQSTSLPVVQNSMTKIDPPALNNLDLSPKISKITENLVEKSVEISAPTIVWRTTKINDGGLHAATVASKRNLSSLPPVPSIENEINTHVPLKCSSPEVIDLVLPQTWSKDLKQSQQMKNHMVEKNLPSGINNGVSSDGNRFNFHPNRLYRNPGSSNCANDLPPVGFGHGGVPIHPNYHGMSEFAYKFVHKLVS